MALEEIREKLPSGYVGKIINSYIFNGHKDAIQYQRDFRITEYEKNKKEEIIFYQSMALQDNGWIFRIDCAMCEDPLYLYMEHEYSYKKRLMKGACVWSDEDGIEYPIGTIITIQDCTEKPEIIPEGIITPCCDNCLKRYSFDRL